VSAQISLQTGDITEFEVDAIVSPCNNDLILGGDVAGEIRNKGGDAIQQECNKLAPIPLGEAAVTGPGTLKCKHVIHAGVMPLGLWADARAIRNGIANSLKRAEERGARSVAIPDFGMGAMNFPAHRTARILFEELKRHLANSKIEKILVVLNEERAVRDYAEVFQEFKGTLEGAAPGPAPQPGAGGVV
jgi:O-acetyl-ADP-ribose deacetylase (regulator of RNase III)